MSALVLLVVCFVAGWAARRFHLLPDTTAVVLNGWIINVSLPALVLRAVHEVRLEVELLWGAVALWLVFALAVAAALVARWQGWMSRPAAGGWALCAGLGNTAFVGLPLVESLGGPGAVGPASVVDQLGTFVVFSLAAVPFAVAISGGTPSARMVLGRVVRFPPFIALAVAVALRPVELPPVVLGPLGRLADMVSPLALASVGFQLDLASVRRHARPVATGLAYKLVVAPALVFLAFVAAQPAPGLTERVVVLQAAMAPMVTASVVAAQHQLEGKLGAALVGVGVPLSLVTVPAWWLMMSRVFT